VLLVENIDRLSRLPVDEANDVIRKIVKGGVEVHTIAPEARFTEKTIHDLANWLPLQIAIALAREESVKKSDRIKDSWVRRRKAVAAGEKVVSAKCPFWLRVNKDRTGWLVLEDKAKLVRQIFRWSVEGLGVMQISERLNADHPGGITGTHTWHQYTVRALLRNRQVLGEFQPRVGTHGRGGVESTRKPVGDPIADYFPRIVTDELFYKVGLGLDARRNDRGGRETGGPTAGVPNLFAGLFLDAADGQTFVISKGRGNPCLVSSGALRKLRGSRFISMPYRVVESVVLALVRELRVKDVCGKPVPDADDEVEQWSSKLTAVNVKIESMKNRATAADDPSLYYEMIDSLGTQRKAIIAGLELAKAKQASPAADVLGDCQSLAEMLAEAEGEELLELRRRTKASLTRLVSEMRMLIAPSAGGKTKAVALQLFFRAGGTRMIIVAYRQGVRTPSGKREAKWRAISTHSDAMPALAKAFDLRKRDHVIAMEKFLTGLDINSVLDAEDDAPPAGKPRKGARP
jgi:DNA invertase Pin-like site-specific DNA recombinase